jgi:hypothetical protein
MKFANANKLDRKSGVRWVERGALVIPLSVVAFIAVPLPKENG